MPFPADVAYCIDLWRPWPAQQDVSSSNSLPQLLCAFFVQVHVQVHAWVTAMSLKSKTLQPWETRKYRPVLTVPVETSKRPQTRSLQAPSKRRSTTPAASKPAPSQPSNQATVGRSNQKQQSLSVALHTMHHPCCLTRHLPVRTDCAQNLLLSKQLQSSQLEIYILCLPWAPVGRFSMLGTLTIHLQ